MLILERLSGESIYINDDTKITIYYSKGNQIKIGVEAPRHVNVMRKELLASKDSEKVKYINKENKASKNQVNIKTKRRKRLLVQGA